MSDPDMQASPGGLARNASTRSARSTASTSSSATITPDSEAPDAAPHTPLPQTHSHTHTHTHAHQHHPHHSRPHSRSHSSRGRPRPQQTIYVPVTTPQGLARAVAERTILGASYPDSPSQWDSSMEVSDDGNGDENNNDSDADSDNDNDNPARVGFDPDPSRPESPHTPPARASGPRTASADDWDNVRDGSISRRPAWRRPSPKWMLPFVIGLSVSVGMTLTPRAELYLDLACLAHPPQRSGQVKMGSGDAMNILSGGSMGTYGSSLSLIALQGPQDRNMLPIERALSPGEKWFMDAQRDIFGIPRGETPSPGSGSPDGPLPLPNGTIPGDGTSPRPGGSTPFPEIDPALCKTDKTVAAAAAKLTMILTICAGFLAAMTTGHWAGVSDRVGRTKILSIVELGCVLNDAIFLLIVSYPRIIMHGGIYVLLAGPTLEGLLGGVSTYSATVHAYISDVTSDGSRVTAFTRIAAFLMMGFSFGPILGSALISATGNILSPFYVSVTVHLLNAILMRFLLPESLSSESRVVLEKRAKAAEQRRREREEAEIAAECAAGADAGESGWSLASVTTTPRRKALGSTRRLARRSIVFLRPLTVFKPRRRDDGVMDYNLALMGVGAFLMSLLMGVIQIKANYTFFAFKWGWAELGPYMSFVGFCRFLVLVGLMPLIVYFVKPFFTERAVIEHQSTDPDASPWRATRDASPRHERRGASPATERTPLLSAGPSQSRRRSSRSSSCSSRSTSPSPGDDAPKPKRTAALDLAVLRASILIDMVAYLIMGLNSARRPSVFIAASALVSLGSASGAAANSLALSFLPHQREAGRIFGGIAVLQALGSNLTAPLLFSSTFAWAVSSPAGWVELIFLVASAIATLALVAVMLVRVPRHSEDMERGRAVGKGRGRGRGRD